MEKAGYTGCARGDRLPAEQNAYDAVEYPGFSYPDTHPDRIAVMAALHGLEPAPVATCRVLEIGCSEGANLIPMAYGLPEAQFTGFDLAGVPIARGRERIRELALTNIQLFQADLLNADDGLGEYDYGEYDYIVAHGVYSWVPEPVRERLLALCAGHLAPGGVAFISYNALPGGYQRRMVHDLMRWRARGVSGAEAQVQAGLDLLALLAEARPESDLYRRLTEEQVGRLRKRQVAVTWHDELSEVFEPVSILDFVTQARRHGLDYLSDSVLPPPNDPSWRPALRSALEPLTGGDAVALEQMLDYARMRMYRETLLVRAEQRVRRDLDPAVLRQMRFASAVVSAAGEQPGSRVFTLSDGVELRCDQAPVIDVVEQLVAAWPRTLAYAALEPTLAAHGLVEEQMPGLLQQMAIARMVEMHLWEPPVAAGVSEQPRATAVSREEVRFRPHVANLWHGTVQLPDPVVRGLLPLLDGTRGRSELLAQLRADFPEVAAAELERGLEANLRHFLRAALLEG